MHGRSVPPLECMTIRLYCTYYRIAKRRMRLTTENGAPADVFMRICRMFRERCVM